MDISGYKVKGDIMEVREICNLYDEWKKEGIRYTISAEREMDAFVAGFKICEKLKETK